MTCKDCVHFEACVDFWYSDYDCFDNIEQTKQKHANDETCKHFTPTADAVEVVRCRECKHYRAYEPPIEDFDGFCTANENEYDKEFYCQYGERREE